MNSRTRIGFECLSTRSQRRSKMPCMVNIAKPCTNRTTSTSVVPMPTSYSGWYSFILQSRNALDARQSPRCPAQLQVGGARNRRRVAAVVELDMPLLEQIGSDQRDFH